MVQPSVTFFFEPPGICVTPKQKIDQPLFLQNDRKRPLYDFTAGFVLLHCLVLGPAGVSVTPLLLRCPNINIKPYNS